MNRNGVIAAGLAATVVGMTGMSFAAVPLYRAFCQATGYNGTPDIRPIAAPGAVAQTITVRFNADTNPGIPWKFEPSQPAVTLPLGDDQVATYWATNQGATTVTGVATYNVTPEKVGKYFHKTACFCFNSQTLEPGQHQVFPLSFWVDPAIATDPDTQDVKVITLSYTFFRSLEDAARTGALAKAGPHVGPLKQPAG